MASETEESGAVEDTGVSIGEDLVSDTFTPGSAATASDQPVQEDASTEDSSGVPAEFDPMDADWIKLRDDQVPDEYKPLLKTARMFQSQADRSRNEAQFQAQQAQQAAETMQQRLASLESQYGVQTPADPREQTNNLLGQFGYAPGSAGYEEASTVAGIAQALLTPLQEKFEALEAQNQQLQGQFGTLQSTSQQQAEMQAQQELDEAIATFGEVDLRDNWDAVKALRGQLNTRTGQGYTVSEALAIVSPAAAEKSTQLRESGQQAKQNAQNRQRPSPAAQPPAAGSAPPLDEAGLTAELQNLGFE